MIFGLVELSFTQESFDFIITLLKSIFGGQAVDNLICNAMA